MSLHYVFASVTTVSSTYSDTVLGCYIQDYWHDAVAAQDNRKRAAATTMQHYDATDPY